MGNTVPVPQVKTDDESLRVERSAAAMELIQGRHERPFNKLHGKDALKLAQSFNASLETLKLSDGQTLETYDFVPEHQTGNPIVYVSGYYTEGDTWRHAMYDMYLQGRRSLCFNAYHGIEPSDAFRTRYADKINALVAADAGGPDIEPQLRKAAALIEMLDAKGLTSVDLLGHSEGGIVSSIAIYLRPDLFSKKALLCPAGMVGDKTTKEIVARKINEDAVVARQRIEALPETISTAIHAGVQSLMPEGLLEPAPEHPLRYRQFSGKYNEDPAADLSAGQFIQAKGTFKAWSHWLATQMTYFLRLKDEYSRGVDAKHLQRELKSLSERRLDRWLALPDMDTKDLTIGAAERDQLYPPNEIATFAARAGIPRILVLEDATHNPQHFQPDKVGAFLSSAFQTRDANAREASDVHPPPDEDAPRTRKTAELIADTTVTKSLHTLSL